MATIVRAIPRCISLTITFLAVLGSKSALADGCVVGALGTLQGTTSVGIYSGDALASGWIACRTEPFDHCIKDFDNEPLLRSTCNGVKVTKDGPSNDPGNPFSSAELSRIWHVDNDIHPGTKYRMKGYCWARKPKGWPFSGHWACKRHEINEETITTFDVSRDFSVPQHTTVGSAAIVQVKVTLSAPALSQKIRVCYTDRWLTPLHSRCQNSIPFTPSESGAQGWTEIAAPTATNSYTFQYMSACQRYRMVAYSMEGNAWIKIGDETLRTGGTCKWLGILGSLRISPAAQGSSAATSAASADDLAMAHFAYQVLASNDDAALDEWKSQVLVVVGAYYGVGSMSEYIAHLDTGVNATFAAMASDGVSIDEDNVLDGFLVNERPDLISQMMTDPALVAEGVDIKTFLSTNHPDLLADLSEEYVANTSTPPLSVPLLTIPGLCALAIGLLLLGAILARSRFRSR